LPTLSARSAIGPNRTRFNRTTGWPTVSHMSRTWRVRPSRRAIDAGDGPSRLVPLPGTRFRGATVTEGWAVPSGAAPFFEQLAPLARLVRAPAGLV
jgi:hypothetical protein